MITAKENMMMAYHHQKPYWTPCQTTDQDTCIPSCLEEGPTGVGLTKDGWGVEWILDDTQPGPFPNEGYTVLDIDDFENWRDIVVFPDYEKYDWEAAAARDTAGWDRENRLSTCIIVNGMLERLNALSGMEGSLMALAMYPEESYDLLSAIADHKIGYIRKIAQYYKPDKITLHDDYGSISRMLMSPETWREIIKPNLKKIIDATHECGMLYEHHSCGYIRPILEDIIEIGADAWNPVQLTNDPEELLQTWAGKFTFVGGFDNLNVLDVPGASYDEKYASIKKTVETLSPYGSWVAEPVMVQMDTAQPLVDLMYEYNKPLKDAVGVPSEKPGKFAGHSAYETADTIDGMKGR